MITPFLSLLPNKLLTYLNASEGRTIVKTDPSQVVICAGSWRAVVDEMACVSFIAALRKKKKEKKMVETS